MDQFDLPFLPTSNAHRLKVPDNKPALIDDQTKDWLTYGDLRERIETAAKHLETKERSVVLCCIPRSIDGVVTYLAAAHAGHAVILSPPDNKSLDELVIDYQPEFVIGDEVGTYQEINWRLETDLYKKDQEAERPHPDFYLMLLTSGSTGSSKGVRLSYKNMASNTEAIIKSIDLKADSVALDHLPLSYSFGLSVLHAQLSLGAKTILSEESMMGGGLWKRAKEEGATLFPGVPYQYEMLMRLGLKRLNVPTMTKFIQAGGKMQKPMMEKMLAEVKAMEGGEFHIMYGQTEAAPRMSSLPLHERPEKIGSAGQALDGGTFTIEDDELVYQGPNVMLGYATKRADLAKGDETNSILYTGDIAKIDDEGFITITGRKQRFAKLFGQRVALDDLEKIASYHAFTVAVEGAEKAILLTLSETPKTHQAIKDDIAHQTGMPSTWFEVRAIDEIPHKPNGKIDYHKIKAMV